MGRLGQPLFFCEYLESLVNHQFLENSFTLFLCPSFFCESKIFALLSTVYRITFSFYNISHYFRTRAKPNHRSVLYSPKIRQRMTSQITATTRMSNARASFLHSTDDLLHDEQIFGLLARASNYHLDCLKTIRFYI